jgi:hypothetical protein
MNCSSSAFSISKASDTASLDLSAMTVDPLPLPSRFNYRASLPSLPRQRFATSSSFPCSLISVACRFPSFCCTSRSCAAWAAMTLACVWAFCWEVAKVYPELVIRGDKGRIDGVRYDELAPMLLNELQHQPGERLWRVY